MYSTQHCFLVLIEKSKEAIDTDNKFGPLLTDLSKAVDCLDQSLLIAKLHWHGLSSLSLKLIFSFFSNRTYARKQNNALVTVQKLNTVFHKVQF